MRQKFRTILCIFLAMVLSLGFSACKEKKPTPPPEYIKISDIIETALKKVEDSAYFGMEITVCPSQQSASASPDVKLYFKKTNTGYDAYATSTLSSNHIVVYLQDGTMVMGQKSASETTYTYTKKTQVSIDDLLENFGLEKQDVNDVLTQVLSQFGPTVKRTEIGYHFSTTEDSKKDVNDILAALRIGKDMRFATILATYTAKTEAQLKTAFAKMLSDTSIFSEIVAELDNLLSSAGLSATKRLSDELQSALGLKTEQILSILLPEYTTENYPNSAYDVIVQELANKTLNEIFTSYGSSLTAEKLREKVMNAIFPAAASDATSLKEAIDFLANFVASKIDDLLGDATLNTDVHTALSKISDFIKAQESVTDLLCSLSAATYSSSLSVLIDEVGFLTNYTTADLICLQQTLGLETSDYFNVDTKTMIRFSYDKPDGVSFEIPAELL